MTPWCDPGQRWLCADTETTGIDVFNDRVVTAYYGYVGGGEETVGRSFLINPGIPIPAGAQAVHGISDEMAAKGDPPAQVIDVFIGELCHAMNRGIPIVMANSPFDLSLLESEARRWGLPTMAERLGRPIGPVIDAMVLDKKAHQYRRGSRKLTALAEHYGVPLTASAAHGAAADALAAARVIWRIGQLGADDEAWRRSRFSDQLWGGYREIAAMTLEELHAAQIGWYRTQSEGLAAHFRKTGKTVEADSVDTSWPVRYAPVTAGTNPP